MRFIKKVHHVAIIASDYQKSKKFYTELLGLQPIREIYREERDSWMLQLAIGDHYVIELFSFPNPPIRPSRPEAVGLRHLAFEVDDITSAKRYLEGNNIIVEEIRTDPHTNKLFTFFSDPDDLPLELYER
jgi:glyoxylase I family protein